MVYQSSNNPLVIGLDESVSEAIAIEVDLHNSDGTLKHWAKSDITIPDEAGKTLICPFTQSESAAWEKGKAYCTVKYRISNGDPVVILRNMPITVGKFTDKTVLGEDNLITVTSIVYDGSLTDAQGILTPESIRQAIVIKAGAYDEDTQACVDAWLEGHKSEIKGDKGDKGDQGDQGETGPQGIQGSQGPQGPQGEKGDTGSQGEAGPTGATGPEGPQGPKGDTGDQGPQGERGEKGPQGEPGPAGPSYDDTEIRGLISAETSAREAADTALKEDLAKKVGYAEYTENYLYLYNSAEKETLIAKLLIEGGSGGITEDKCKEIVESYGYAVESEVEVKLAEKITNPADGTNGQVLTKVVQAGGYQLLTDAKTAEFMSNPAFSLWAMNETGTNAILFCRISGYAFSNPYYAFLDAAEDDYNIYIYLTQDCDAPCEVMITAGGEVTYVSGAKGWYFCTYATYTSYTESNPCPLCENQNHVPEIASGLVFYAGETITVGYDDIINKSIAGESTESWQTPDSYTKAEVDDALSGKQDTLTADDKQAIADLNKEVVDSETLPSDGKLWVKDSVEETSKYKHTIEVYRTTGTIAYTITLINSKASAYTTLIDIGRYLYSSGYSSYANRLHDCVNDHEASEYTDAYGTSNGYLYVCRQSAQQYVNTSDFTLVDTVKSDVSVSIQDVFIKTNGDYYSIFEPVNDKLDGKQDTLTAGAGITISEDGTISVSYDNLDEVSY